MCDLLTLYIDTVLILPGHGFIHYSTICLYSIPLRASNLVFITEFFHFPETSVNLKNLSPGAEYRLSVVGYTVNGHPTNELQQVFQTSELDLLLQNLDFQYFIVKICKNQDLLVSLLSGIVCFIK